MTPFIMAVPVPTLTRVFKSEIDEAAGTAKIYDVIDGTYLNEKTDKYHIASRPIFTDYDMENDTVSFELSGTRNPNEVTHEGFFSYRTYKSAK